MGSTEVWSWETLRGRYRAVSEGSDHLRKSLPLDNPHNAILRPRDVARYIGLDKAALYWLMHATSKRMGEASQDKLEHYQRLLTRFFQSWDKGLLIKARTDDGWKVVSRHVDPRLAQVAPAAGQATKVIPLTIDRATLGLKVGR